MSRDTFCSEMSQWLSNAARLIHTPTPAKNKREFFEELNGSLRAVFRATGCMVRCSRDKRMAWEYDGQPPEQFEDIVRSAYVTMFAEIYPKTFSNHSEYSLFAGLGWRSRWEACLVPPNDPHNIATRLIRITKWAQSLDAKMSVDEQNSLLPVLNGWCKPSTPWTALPGTRDICAHLFGDIWWDIYRPDLNVDIDESEQLPSGDWEAWDFHYFTCHELVRKTTPPFLPGVLPDYRPVPHVSLPDLYT